MPQACHGPSRQTVSDSGGGIFTDVRSAAARFHTLKPLREHIKLTALIQAQNRSSAAAHGCNDDMRNGFRTTIGALDFISGLRSAMDVQHIDFGKATLSGGQTGLRLSRARRL